MTVTIEHPTTAEATTTTRPVAYSRISRFRVTSNGLNADVERGVDRQTKDADTYAEQAGLGPVRHIVDNNRSASEFATKVREGWEELLDVVRAGEATHVLVWLLDRAVRQVSDVDDLLDACRAGGAVIVQTGTGSVIDPNNPESRLHAQISAAVAEYEVAKMSMRMRRRKAEDAEKGRAHGGRRAFGYEPGMTGIRESEAAALRAAVRGLLAGKSLYLLAQELNDAGLPGTGGAQWTGPNLRQTLMRPYLAGLRVHTTSTNAGARTRTKAQTITKGTWDPIISESDYLRVVALLSDPRRRTSPTSNARRYLLTGLAVCDACGAKLRSGNTGRRSKTPSYRCPTGKHVQRTVEMVDAIVETYVVGLLSRSSAASLFANDDVARELDELEVAKAANRAQVVEANTLRRDGKMTMAAYATVTADLEAEAQRLDARIAALAVTQSGAEFEGLVGPTAATAWADLPQSRKRAVIDRLVEVRLRSDGKGTRFRPENVIVRRRALAE